MNSYLIKKGIEKSSLLSYLQQEKESSVIKKIVSNTGSLGYVIKYDSVLSEEPDDQIAKLAAYFTGKQISNGQWNGIWNKKQEEYALFEKADAAIKMQKADENIMTDDSQNKYNTIGNREDDTKQTILLFNNGNHDITSRNNDWDKKIENNNLICDNAKYLVTNKRKLGKLNKTYSNSFLLKNFFIVDSSTSIDNAVFQSKKLLHTNLKIKKEKKPQILIFHTHGASESFVGSRKGKKEDSIIGVGSSLAKVLSEKYHYQVLHDETEYDRINGNIDRNKAYNNAYNGLKKTLRKYPSIQVVIDLHRDGVGNKVKRTTIVNGKRTAQAMFFNGLSRNANGNIKYLYNKNLQGNLAFSLQLKIASMNRFQNFARAIYLKGYRYNMHLRKRFTLIELGNENNTLQEAKNAAEPLAMIFDAVLSGKK